MTLADSSTPTIGVTHTTTSGSLKTTLAIERPDASAIDAAAREIYHRLLDERLLAPARALPSVQTYIKLRDKFTTMQADGARIRLLRKQVEIDHESATLDLVGKPLVAAMLKIETRRQEATEQLDAHQQAESLFTPRVTAAHATAITALAEHLLMAIQSIGTDIGQRIAAAKDAIDKALALGAATANVAKLLDNHAIATRLAEYLGIERRTGIIRDQPWQTATALPAGFVSLGQRAESILSEPTPTTEPTEVQP